MRIRRLVISTRGLRRRDMIEIVKIFRASIEKVNIIEIEKKVIITKNKLGKKTIVQKLYNYLPIVTINRKMIAKLEKG